MRSRGHSRCVPPRWAAARSSRCCLGLSLSPPLALAWQGKPPPHPLATLLSSLPQVRSARLSSYHFTRLINAREAHFLNPSFPTLQSLADYSAGTQASLLYLQLQALEPTAGAHEKLFEHEGGEHAGEDGFEAAKKVDSLMVDHAASHLAVATTIAVLLRSIPHHATKRINLIPAEIGTSSALFIPFLVLPHVISLSISHPSPACPTELTPRSTASRHSLTEESLFREGPNAPGLRESVATLVGIAEAELRTSRACFDGTSGLPERCAPAFLAAVRLPLLVWVVWGRQGILMLRFGQTPARSFLARLASDEGAFDVFGPQNQKRYWKLPFQVWGDARNRRY